MHHAIQGYYIDVAGHWVAKLDCGHNQALPHNPPMSDNPWVMSQRGRNDKIGVLMVCAKCIEGAPRDRQFSDLAGEHAG
jgi:Protein of unknown function (DUF3565)